MTMKRQATFDAARMLELVSRTFALGIEQLPPRLREPITVAYLLLRVSDYLEDNLEMSAERKVELLRLWASIMDGRAGIEELTAQLEGTDPEDPEAEVARQAGEVLALLRKLPRELQEIILEEVIASTIGMARWQARGPEIRDEEELDDYMFEVAGRVGLMLTRIFAWYARPIHQIREDLMPLAREFGLALQTVNIMRNMREDFERGWIFAPESFCKRVGLDRRDLFKPEMSDKALEVVGMLADKADRHSRKGLDYIKLIPGRFRKIRLFCSWPLFFAVRTIAISRGNSQVLEHEAKISREEVWRIIEETAERIESNDWLDDYYEKLETG
jgi:farnesyl-diphosphate farnesyltransferase